MNPWEDGSGPTISMCTISNRASGVAKVDMGITICLWIFDFWQLMHVLAIVKHLLGTQPNVSGC